MRIKLIYIIIGAVILLAVIGTLIFFFGKNSSSTTQDPANSGTADGSSAVINDYGTAPSGSRLSLQTEQGQVNVNNFYNGKTVANDTPAITIAQGDGYAIWYFRADSSFEIQLSGNNAARPAAENALITTLGINNADACKLNVSVTVPIDSSAQQAPIGGLSFCSQ